MPEPLDYESREKPRPARARALSVSDWIVLGCLLGIFTALVYLFGS
jgi:hypothetical protein